MTADDFERRRVFLTQQRDIEREQRAVNARKKRDEEDRVKAAENRRKYDEYWGAVEAAEAKKRRRGMIWDCFWIAFWTIVVVGGLWACSVATAKLP